MRRRHFLTALAFVACSPSSARTTGSISDGIASGREISIDEQLLLCDPSQVELIRNEILGGQHQFLNPWLAEWFFNYYADSRETSPEANAWILSVAHGNRRLILDYVASDDQLLGADKCDFARWLSWFHPINDAEWMMVPTLYVWQLCSGLTINWSEARIFASSVIPHLDLICSLSRGVLMWRWQLEKLIANTLNVSSRDSVLLARSYLRRQPNTLEWFSSVRYGSISVLDAIAERTLQHRIGISMPDRILATFLAKHYVVATTNRRTKLS